MRRQPAASFVLIVILAAVACAQTTQPAPLLQQISRETQSLYESIRPSLVLVQLPPPKWLTAAIQQQQNQLLQKWANQLNPAIRKKLEDGAQAAAPEEVNATVASSTQPATESSRKLRVVQRADGRVDLLAGPVQDDREAAPQGPRSLGVIVNDEGYVLIPFFIERDVIGNRSVKVYHRPGQALSAQFVGSDEKTNLTLLKLDKPVGKPIATLGHRPASGSMVMVLLTNGEAGQLLIWTGALQDSGAIFGADGSLLGFSRAGQFLSGEQTRPVVDQLMRYGLVKRAVLGVTVRQYESPSGQPAVQVAAVVPDSPAHLAGLQPGDVINSLAGKPVTDVPTFAAAIATSDGPTEIIYSRDSESAPTKITVELHPQ